MIISTLLSFLTIISAAKADANWKTVLRLNNGSPEFWSCDSAVTSYLVFDFATNSTLEYAAYYDVMCGYDPCVGSMMLCCDKLANSDQAKMKKIYLVAASSCAEYSSFHHDWTYFRDQHKNATNKHLLLEDIKNTSMPIYLPAYTNMTAAFTTFDGYKAFYQNLDDATYYAIGNWLFFALVLVITSVFNLLKRIGLHVNHNNIFVNHIKSFITIPALFPNGNYQRPFGWKYLSILLPNRQDSIILSLFTIFQIVIYSLPYNQDEAASLFTTSTRAWQRFVADRSGILAFGKVPLLIIFAGRNNFLGYLTGKKYSDFIQYHKIIATWMFLDALIHSIYYTILEKGEYTLDLQSLYFVCGVIATSLAGGIILFALHPFRRYMYECFLYFHIIMVVAFIVMCWYHCQELGWCEWIILSCALWVFDRLFRIVRMIRFGYKKAHVEMINDTLFKITINKPKSFHSTPGQYGFIYFKDPLLFFQNHPFTIIESEENILCYIKAKRGITSHIMKRLMRSPEGVLDTYVCVEGPYGKTAPIHHYKKGLLIAGGTGIPGIIDYAIKFGKQNLSCTRIKFVWIIGNLDGFETYIHDLISQLRNQPVEIDFYLTHGNASEMAKNRSKVVELTCTKNFESSDSESDQKPDDSVDFIHIKYGRPNIKNLLKENIGEASCAIVSCGPDRLEDNIRAEFSIMVKSSKETLDLFDELQVW